MEQSSVPDGAFNAASFRGARSGGGAVSVDGDASDLRERVAELEASLAVSREALDAAERRHRMDLLLIEAEAVDLQTARLLAEVALGEVGTVEEAVARVRSEKPFLFVGGSAGDSGGVGVASAMAMSGHGDGGDAASARLLELAERAAERGDRSAVLRYLRARRAM